MHEIAFIIKHKVKEPYRLQIFNYNFKIQILVNKLLINFNFSHEHSITSNILYNPIQ